MKILNILFVLNNIAGAKPENIRACFSELTQLLLPGTTSFPYHALVSSVIGTINPTSLSM